MKRFWVIPMVVLGSSMILLFLGARLDLISINSEVRISDLLTFISIFIAFSSLALTNDIAQKNFRNVKYQMEYTSKQLKITEEQLRESQSEKIRLQASQVAAWFENIQIPGHAEAIGINGGILGTVVLQNSSTIPVYDFYILPTNNQASDDFGKIQLFSEYVKYIDTLKPGTTKVNVETGGSSMGGVRPSIAIVFKDADSRYWFRGPHGKLKLIDRKYMYQVFEKDGIKMPIV
ncbi:hypothetical protein [Levilactobacillus acidifarinae]|uniref:hypothetical protein n=1 Tax=Levilactobacillus acidifarinae TaxID=267364 RepID=UPI00070CCD5E|nr:hypothetical protein [Levilactobacillus acidifarinae]GEO69222.1 hypothetical protein LAC03_11320 [Levilactobacillus acidifarinae]